MICKHAFTLPLNCKIKRLIQWAKTIIETLSQFPDELVKSVTCDRETEFANLSEIEQALNCDVYFADPYCAW